MMGASAKRKRDPMTVVDDRWLHIKYYGCKNCGKKYKWKDSLIRHHRYVCGKDPQHSCPICGIKIRYKWLLKKHLIDTHEWKIPKGIHI
ncbi:hypothetical protein HZH68_012361 [Vespula germanica]|uniref:C2H2-type domain-containing protein n=1 Tax=Vespula germanica TaxID=30212 RepID=A0A834JHH0_VESGE|nr:hypothetical protein HZH68_012361 [Vespula germanica]